MPTLRPILCPFFNGLLAILAFLVTTPPAAAHIEEGNMPDGIAQVEYRILLEFEPDNIAVRNKLGMVYYRLGKLDAAAEQFQAVLARDPKNFNAIDALGLVALKRGRPAEALARFQKAITMNPADTMVYLHLGEALEQLHRPEEARAAYEKARANLAAEPASSSKADRARQIEERLRRITGGP